MVLTDTCWYHKLESATHCAACETSMFAPWTESECSVLLPTDGKTSVMAMTAKTSSGDITDMDCSSAEIEELIKEVRPFLTLSLTSAPSPSSGVCVSRCASLPLSFSVTFFIWLPHCAVSSNTFCTERAHPPTWSSWLWSVQRCFVDNLLGFCFFWFFVFQEDIQASPEYWPQSSINSKASFCISHRPFT